MEWYEKAVWYAVLGFAMTKSWQFIGLIKEKVNGEPEVVE